MPARVVLTSLGPDVFGKAQHVLSATPPKESALQGAPAQFGQLQQGAHQSP